MTPPVAQYEVANSIVKAVRNGRLPAEAGRVAIDEVFDLVIEIVGDVRDAELAIRAAYPVAERIQGSIYDAIFLVVSEAIGAPFITAEKPTWEASKTEFDVIFLKDFHIP